jgi:hypothetical protein
MSETRETSLEGGHKDDDAASTRPHSASAHEATSEKSAAPPKPSPATPENSLSLRLFSVFAAWLLFVMAWVSIVDKTIAKFDHADESPM